MNFLVHKVVSRKVQNKDKIMDKTKNWHLTIRIPKELKEQMEAISREMGTNTSNLVRDILMKNLREKNQEKLFGLIIKQLADVEKQNHEFQKLLAGQLSLSISLIQKVFRTDPNDGQKIIRKAAMDTEQLAVFIKKFNDLAKS